MKNKLHLIFYILSLLLLIIFIAVISLDHRMCYKCDPGYFFVLLFKRMYEFMLPSLFSFISALILKHKNL